MQGRLFPRERDLDDLIATLDIDIVASAECSIGHGCGLTSSGNEWPGIYYILDGRARMLVGDTSAILLVPHSLVITPPKQSFRIEAMFPKGRMQSLQAIEVGQSPGDRFRKVESLTVGGGEPAIRMVYHHFRASYGSSVHLFAALRSPIIEQFDIPDRIQERLLCINVELRTQQAGMDAITKGLLKQVLVALLRRSLGSAETWQERFAMLCDPLIARVFADMMARPGARHSLSTLSRTAGLSRSAFMSRFSRSLESPPMTVLREVRMRHASNLLAANILSIEQVAHAVGYASRSSFCRTFRQLRESDPSSHEAAPPSQDGVDFRSVYEKRPFDPRRRRGIG